MRTSRFIAGVLFLSFLLNITPAEARHKYPHYQPKKYLVCDRTTLAGKIKCSANDLYLGVKSEVRESAEFIKKYYKISKRTAKRAISKVSLPGLNLSDNKNDPPVISGDIRALKYGNGVNPYVYLDLPGGFSDPDGSIVKVTWDLGDGSIIELNEGEFSSAGHIVHVFKESNHYNVTVTVEDDLGLTASKSTYVETPENSEPSVSVTATSIGSNVVRYNISAQDEDGSTFTYSSWACPWQDTSTQVDCDYLAPGTFEFFTRVTDSKGTSVEALSYVTVDGTSISATPVPILRASTFFGEAPLTVDFDASKSFDINGQIVSYRWAFGDWGRPQNSSTQSNVSHTFTKPGTYRVELFVKDDDDQERSTYWDIYVAPTTNIEPQIIATYGGPNTVNFIESNSAYGVPAGEGMFWWDFGDGETHIGRWAQHTYASSGTYTVKLKLIDINGETHLLEKDVTIGTSDDSPVSSHSISHYEAKLGENITFDGTSSSDPAQSQALEFFWVFDDGEHYDDDSFIRSFTERGIYNFELWVTNTRGLSAMSSTILQIHEPFSTLDARITFDPKVGYGPLTVNLDGSPTVSGNPIVYREWDTPAGLITEETAEFTVEDPGNYYFRYFVKDSLGNVAMEFGDVRVLSPNSIPSGNLSPVAVINHHNSGGRVYDFDCFSSTDADDYVAYCSWKINGKPLIDNQWVSTTLAEDILYTVELTVTDSWGAESTVYRQFDFSANTGQLITFDYSPLRPVANEEVTFGAENSRVPGKDILSYEWDFGDSTSGSGRVVQHTYTSAGTYDVELTITDSDNTPHTFSREVVVLATAPALAINVTARDSSLAGKVQANGTYKALGAPEKVIFEVSSTSTSPKAITEATWTFDDGGSAVGTSVDHTFHRPGTYTVTVNAKDSVGSPIQGEITVEVPGVSGCYARSGETICLSDSNSDSNNVSELTDVWTLNHDQGAAEYSSNPDHYQDGWAKIYVGDNEEINYDASKAVVAEDDSLYVYKNLLPKEIDLNLPHELKIATKSATGIPMIGTWPLHFLGTSSLTVTVGEEDVKLKLFNPSAQYRKDVDLGSATSYTFYDLPKGDYSLIAVNESSSDVQILHVSGATSTQVSFGSSLLKKNLKNRKMARIAKQKRSSDWTQSLCGESTPFPKAKDRAFATGETKYWSFSSTEPLAASTFKAIPESFNQTVRLSCGIKSPGLLYGQNKWKYKDGPARCWEGGKPHFYWNEYLTTLEHEDDPVVVKYEVRDAWTGEKISGEFVTSAKGLMKEADLKLEDLTAKIGLPDSENSDWAQRVNYEITVPAQFVRPEVRFELYSHHDSSPESLYAVDCDVLNTTEVPRLGSIEAVGMNNSANSSEENGRLSLTRKYGFFPVQYDGRATSPVSTFSDIAKATYTANINFYGQSEIIWQGVEVVFKYAGDTHTEVYDFTGAGSTDTERHTYSNQFTIDTQDLENVFIWVKGESDVSLQITPLGKETNDYDFRGESRTYTFKALFDLQTVREESSQVCENGFFGTELSTFGRDDLISVLVNANAPSGNTRCGNVSLPFGGPFNLSSSWFFSGHQKGNEGVIRSFNDESVQDDYDSISPSSLRIADVNSYMDFANQLDVIMAAQYEDINGEPTDKKKIVEYCNPESDPVIYPCTEGTTFQNMTRELAHQVCLINSHSTFIPPGCPEVELDKLIRFSRWAEQNSNVFLNLFKTYPAKVSMSTGLYQPASSAGDMKWQELAIQYGVWPDGMPILKADPVDDIFNVSKINDCHLSTKGCSTLKKLFSEGNSSIESNVIKTGWN